MDLLGGTFSLLLSNLAQMPSFSKVERGASVVFRPLLQG